MSDILFQYYRVNPTTWFYLSSLLSIALFFKFNRLWSVRNLDLIGLILLAPGLLAVEYGGYKASAAVFLGQLRQMFGWIFPNDVSLEGFWALPFNDAVFRLPVLAAFVAMMATLAIWPSPKNLGTLLSCSAAVLLGSQFWKAHNGGLFMAWFLPLLLLTVFRPNLENRVALLVLDAEWFPKRRR